MKTRNLFYGMLMGLALGACSNEDLRVDDNPTINQNGEAYLAVKLMDTASSRGTDGGLQDGACNEHAVEKAEFYFYDANGYFVAQGSVWNGGSDDKTSLVNNIEFKSNTVVVLKGLTQTSLPKYMVTVLNPQSGFKPETTLDKLEKQLSLETGVGITYDSSGTNHDGTSQYDKCFTMSTASYDADESKTSTQKFFVTPLVDGYFHAEPIDYDELDNLANDKVITVHVERLAAKVEVAVNGQIPTVEEIGGKNYYKLTSTVAGEPNEGIDTAETPLYVSFEGWALNATAKKSNIVKNINESWTDGATTKDNLETALGFDWNDYAKFRSYWGMSFNYGAGYTYPTSGYDLKKTNDNVYPLNYVSWNSLSGTLGNTTTTGSVAYCAENTNTSEVVSANFPSAVTSVLIKARVYLKDEAGTGLRENFTLIRYNGMLYTQSHFMVTVLQQANPNLYKMDGNIYSQIPADLFELVNAGDGRVTVQVTDDADKAAAVAEYIYDNTGKKYENDTDIAAEKAKVSNFIKYEGEDAVGEAIAYNEGMMYYNIPIEHLNDQPGTKDSDNKLVHFTDGNGKRIYAEAEYGVVRNHWYKITIESLTNLGMGVYDPDEFIVPSPDPEKYYVGARINILSWKIVNQGVDL